MHELRLDAEQLGAIAEEVLRRGALLSFRARGGSMFPFVRDGDELTVAPPAARDIGRGDIVVYRSGDRRLVVHRVARISGKSGSEFFHVRGDAHRGSGVAVPRIRILGRVVSVNRAGRKLSPDAFGHRLALKFWRFLLPATRTARRSNRALKRLVT